MRRGTTAWRVAVLLLLGAAACSTFGSEEDDAPLPDRTDAASDGTPSDAPPTSDAATADADVAMGVDSFVSPSCAAVPALGSPKPVTIEVAPSEPKVGKPVLFFVKSDHGYVFVQMKICLPDGNLVTGLTPAGDDAGPPATWSYAMNGGLPVSGWAQAQFHAGVAGTADVFPRGTHFFYIAK